LAGVAGVVRIAVVPLTQFEQPKPLLHTLGICGDHIGGIGVFRPSAARRSGRPYPSSEKAIDAKSLRRFH
jgi:hypothetical protein